MIKNYIITALRNLWRNKFFSLINIFGLSIGITCCMLIFLYTKDEISFDRFHKNQENIYRVTAKMITGTNVNPCASTGMMPGPAFKEHVPEVESFVRIQAAGFSVRHNNDMFDQEALFADENMFSVFSFPFLHGNPKTALKDIYSVVISETVAKKYFGKTNVVGQTLELNTGKKLTPFVITGVTKNSPQNSSIKIQMILPMKYNQLENDDKTWMNFFLNTFVVLKPNSNLKAVETKLNSIYNSDAKAELKEMAEKYNWKEKVEYQLQPITSMHLDTEYPANNGLKAESNPVYSYILTGIALFVLLIACINFINLTVARSLKRAKEIGIRKVVGSQRKQLVFQFLGESFVLSFFAFVCAVLLAVVVLPFFNLLAEKELSFSYLMDSKLIFGYVGLFLLTGLLAGFYPALVLSRFNPVQTLYGKFRFTGKNYLSKGLIVFQFTLATFLIVATITIYSQFNYLIDFDLGYDCKNTVRITTPPLRNNEQQVFRSELKQIPGVSGITTDQGGSWNTMANINEGKEITFNIEHVDYDFFPAFKIPIVQGRNFSLQYPTDSTKAIIVNESFVKKAGWKQPIGQVVDFYYHKEKFTVIGVIKDYHFEQLTERVKPQLFTASLRYKRSVVFVKIDPANKWQALKQIEKKFKALYPIQPYQYTFLEDQIEENYNKEAKWKQIITFSAVLTIFISCIGLFGLASLSAQKRAKEIGIRKVLGASVAIIVRNLSVDFLKLVFVAAAIASPLAWWIMNKWLQNYPYRIEMKLTMFGFAVVIIVLVAFITVCYQSIKAAISNPVKSLRTE